MKIEQLAATLARMHRAWISRFSGSRVRRRSHVIILGLALCLWSIAFATHIHADGDHLSPSSPSNACSFCLSLPSGATPPAQPVVALPQFIATETVVDVVTTLVARAAPSFYLSRGPPAR